MADNSQFTYPNNQPVVVLDCKTAFTSLTKHEKLYAHYLSQASWYGGLIVLFQTSPESPVIFLLLHKMYRSQPLAELKKTALSQEGITDEHFQALLVYSSGIYTNMGNYKGTGDTKFIPNLPADKLEAILKASQAYREESETMQELWDLCQDAMYSLSDSQTQLGLGDKGISTYFTSNCTMADAEIVSRFLKKKKMDAYNTRVFKTSENEQVLYEVRLASLEGSADPAITSEVENFAGVNFQVTRGDHSRLMGLVAENLKKAKEHAANESEVHMLEKYVSSFTTGSLADHKDGSRFWIQDKGPVIESYIGFIETYRDPAGMRGEFEGFVAMVNKNMSTKFMELVNQAETFLPQLPWPAAYEKDTFLRPDFTSLDVLTFAGSGIPAGINIPNYDEIRQNEGFKNVSLGNVITASYKDTVISFLSAEDRELLLKYRIPAFEVQVGLHELLGHGSGKLFRRNKEGKFNFDKETVLHTELGEKITKWYEEGETYDSKFTSLSSSYEECRAECVGLYLSLHSDILKIFGYEGEEAELVKYVNWLSLLWNAVGKALEMYQAKTKSWLQAHAQARYVILQVLLEAGEGLVRVIQTKGEDGNDDLLLTLDRSKLETVGKNALRIFLRKLQVFKSTGDVDAARKMYDKYSEVSDTGTWPWAKWRDIVLARKQPRKMFVQPNTKVKEDEIFLCEYEANPEGLIQSWVERFPKDNIDQILQELWEKDQQYFS